MGNEGGCVVQLWIYQIPTNPNIDPCAYLKHNLAWNYLYSPYRLSVYFAELNNALTIFCSVKDIVWNKIKNDGPDIVCKY